MIGFLIALLSGALMSIQGVFNTNVTKQTSLWVSTGWVQFSAFLVCVGRKRLGTVYGFCGLSCDVVFYRKRSGFTAYGSTAEIYAVRRCDRRRDHMDGYKKYRSVRACAFSSSHCDRTAYGCLSDPAFRIVWNGSGAVLMEKSRWSPSCGCRHSSFSMEIKVINL